MGSNVTRYWKLESAETAANNKNINIKIQGDVEPDGSRAKFVVFRP